VLQLSADSTVNAAAPLPMLVMRTSGHPLFPGDIGILFSGE
jgi:hypothetical protein